ncbi:MAG: cytochrome d ubiquinol oxidase subunit II, partial [Candidatus Acidiferrales bacterium]
HIWSVFWDAVFSLASILLAIFFGAALGNVARGVPLNSAGNFFEPLWTNFQPTGQTGILDWYTVLVGLVALAVLTLHGALWLAWRTDGVLNGRAHAAASLFWWLVAGLTVVITFTSFRLLPVGLLSFRVHPWGFVFPLLAIAGLLGVKLFLYAKQEAAAFAASSAYIVGMLTSVTFTLYPNVLPATTGIANNLTVANAKAADYGLKIGLIWWLIGMSLAVTYTIFSYRNSAGKIQAGQTHRHGHY